MLSFNIKLKCVLVLSLVLPVSTIAQNVVTNQLSKNLSNYFLTENQAILNAQLIGFKKDNYNGDQVINQLYQKRSANTVSIEKILGNFGADSTWTDINYNDKERSGWELKNHVDRILLLTKEYLSKDSKYYKSQSVSQKIHQALGYWFKYMPQNKNWWYNEIGIPKSMGETLVMFRLELSEQECHDGLKVMNQSHFGMTGQNKVWLAGNMFYKALLTDDEKLAKQARDTIVSEIKVSGNEGIKPDFSFQQHGPQQQFGNYGMAYLATMASWANIFTNTSFQLNPNELAILRNLFQKGFSQIVWKGYFDTNSLGRQFFKHAQQQKALATAFAAYDLMNVDPEHKNIYKDFIDRNFSGSGKPLLTGITNFYTSDMSVYRSKDWYNSIKMSSIRVIGAETGNDENLKGYYLGDGASYISVSGKEYLDIFPLWNWRNLPGVTCYATNEPLKELTFKGYRNNNNFAGGISNGLNGVTAFVLNRDSLTAKKAYFYINNQMVCLGADITTSQNEPVVTTLNQTWLNGDVTYLTNKVNTLKDESAVKNQNMAWVYHDQITYVPLNGTRLDISNQVYTGSWSNVIAKYPKDSISGKIFTVNVSLVQKPQQATYAYAILPNYKPVSGKNANLNFAVLQNNQEAQIVKSKDAKLLILVVYKAVKKNFEGLGMIEFKQPGLYQLENISGKWQITLADPTQKIKLMNVVVNGKMNQFKMPDGLYSGKAVHQTLSR